MNLLIKIINWFNRGGQAYIDLSEDSQEESLFKLEDGTSFDFEPDWNN